MVSRKHGAPSTQPVLKRNILNSAENNQIKVEARKLTDPDFRKKEKMGSPFMV